MGEPRDDIVVVCSDEQIEVRIDRERWRALAVEVLRAEACQGELTLTFVDRDEIAELNRVHMGVDGPTDVLSFPLDADLGGVRADASSGIPVLIGDVVICPAVAAEAAPNHAGSLDDELALLVVHGILHVVGHDHLGPTDTRLMRTRELELLESHHWCGPAPKSFSAEHHD